ANIHTQASPSFSPSFSLTVCSLILSTSTHKHLPLSLPLSLSLCVLSSSQHPHTSISLFLSLFLSHCVFSHPLNIHTPASPSFSPSFSLSVCPLILCLLSSPVCEI